ncbi:Dabb family protein [Novosphingobium sp. BL-52-GroH]|uniref:Dabb family protein n=1 Tax=Novosphingobium sp. BL-52-GroH TaxID=3349877 RepID=UPI00384B111C
MFVHVFLFKWLPGVTEAQIDRAIAEIYALKDAIPGIDSVEVGRNVSPNARGYGLGGVMRFADAATYANYADHPAHQELLKFLVPLIEAVEVDFHA